MSEKTKWGETTDWFHPSVKPVHVGVYQRRIGEMMDPNFAYWDGKRWSAFVGCLGTPDDALKEKRHASAFHGLKWRGLAQKPA